MARQLTYGLTKYDTGIGPQGPVDQRINEVTPNIWWRLLRETEDQLAKYSTAVLRAGAERRQIELQEAQALHLATAINRILDALNLSPNKPGSSPQLCLAYSGPDELDLEHGGHRCQSVQPQDHRYLNSIRSRPDADELVDEILDAYHRARRVVDLHHSREDPPRHLQRHPRRSGLPGGGRGIRGRREDQCDTCGET